MGSLTPRLQKDWTITPNERLTPYVSLAATMGWWAYRNKEALLASGWTMVFSSTGAAGPSSAGDTTDRIASAASFATRVTGTGTSQSWFVVENSLGCQLLIAYMGASDDICLVAYSQGGLFTPQGYTFPTNTYQPTATDKAFISIANSVINATTSGDRVMTTWVEPDSWANAIFRGGSLVGYMGLETFDSAVNPSIQAAPMLAFRFTSGSLVNSAAHPLITFANSFPGDGAGWVGVYTFHNYAGTYKYTRGMAYAAGWVTGGFGYVVNPNTNPWQTSTSTPRLQNNAAIGLIPLILNGVSSNQTFSFSDTENYGFMGVAQDWFWGMNHNTLLNDVFAGYEPTDLVTDAPRSNWMIAFGPGCIRPWKNASGSGMELA
jgi:hypothetical protein